MNIIVILQNCVVEILKSCYKIIFLPLNWKQYLITKYCCCFQDTWKQRSTSHKTQFFLQFSNTPPPLHPYSWEVFPVRHTQVANAAHTYGFSGLTLRLFLSRQLYNDCSTLVKWQKDKLTSRTFSHFLFPSFNLLFRVVI